MNLTGTGNVSHWVMKNIPAMRKRGYTNSIKNYVSKLEFQLAGINIPITHTMTRWVTGCCWLRTNEERIFWRSLSKNNTGWMMSLQK